MQEADTKVRTLIIAILDNNSSSSCSQYFLVFWGILPRAADLRKVELQSASFQFIDALNFAAGEYVHKQISPIFSHSFVEILTKRSF